LPVKSNFFDSTDCRDFLSLDRQSRVRPSLNSTLHVDNFEPRALKDARGDRGTASRQALGHYRLVSIQTLDIPQKRAEESVLCAGDVPGVKFRRRADVD
jgi:hypothetical protein